MREQFRVERPDLPEGITRGENFDLHEGDFLAWSATMGFEPPLVRDIYTDVHNHIVAGGGRLTRESIEELARAYTPRLGAKSVETLKKWWLTKIQPS